MQRLPSPLRSRRTASSATLILAAFVAIAAAASPASAVSPGLVATDGYFDVSRIDARTYAIHESRYWQMNILYVLKGSERSILIDSGSGTRDVAFVADKVTKKPMTVVASHLHYDHIGSHGSFKRVAMVDLPETREATSDGWYSPPLLKSLWAFTSGFTVTDWWKPGDVIDIGDREIEVVHIPGHSTDSIALIDRKSGYAFVGDFLYKGPLLADIPGSDLATYLKSTRMLLEEFPEVTTIFGAHFDGRMPREALVELEQSLSAILEGRAQGKRVWWTGWLSAEYPGGDGFTIVAAP